MPGGKGACRRVDGEAGEAGEQFGEYDAGLQPGGDSAQAVVRADGERQVPRPDLPAAQDVKVSSAGTEHMWVPVG